MLSATFLDSNPPDFKDAEKSPFLDHEGTGLYQSAHLCQRWEFYSNTEMSHNSNTVLLMKPQNVRQAARIAAATSPRTAIHPCRTYPTPPRMTRGLVLGYVSTLIIMWRSIAPQQTTSVGSNTLIRKATTSKRVVAVNHPLITTL